MSTPAHTPRDPGDAGEAALDLKRQLRGHIRPHLRTILDETRRLAEIEVLSPAGRSVDAIAAAAQRIAAAIDDFEADALRESVGNHARESAPGDRPPATRSGARQLLRGSMDVRTTGQQVACRVELLHRGRSFWGEAEELDTPGGRARAAARATLIATQQAVEGARLALENVAFVDFASGRYITVSIEAGTTRNFAQLAGIARLDRSHEETACLAALNALERWTDAPAHRSITNRIR